MTPARIDAVGWGWRHSGRRDRALRDLELRVEPGERILLLGASGAGKSTLLRALAGVLGDEDGDSEGSLLIDGHPVGEVPGRAGLLLQDPDSQVILSRVGDDVAFGCENLGVAREEIWRRVPDALRSVGLDLPLDHPTSQLSGGQKQRLALAGVLAMRPGVLLLDEPTANLDPDGVVAVRDAVVRVQRETDATMIVIEHRVDAWWQYVDRVIVLGPNGIEADAAPERILRDAGDRLAASGVWLPGTPTPEPRRATPGAALLTAEGLAVARTSARVGGPVAADGIAAVIRAGTLTAVSGPNGGGKSTLGLTLGGLLAPRAGLLRAEPPLADRAAAEPIRWRSRQLVPRIGSVFQDPEHQFLARTVREELGLGPRMLGLEPDAVRERVDALLQRLRLERLAEANPFTLSGGEKRRLSVGTALATQPRLLVLDEPTFGQDSRTWRDVAALLGEQLDQGTAVVAITHDERLVAALADANIRLDGVHSDAPEGKVNTPSVVSQ